MLAFYIIIATISSFFVGYIWQYNKTVRAVQVMADYYTNNPEASHMLLMSSQMVEALEKADPDNSAKDSAMTAINFYLLILYQLSEAQEANGVDYNIADLEIIINADQEEVCRLTT